MDGLITKAVQVDHEKSEMLQKAKLLSTDVTQSGKFHTTQLRFMHKIIYKILY